MTPQTPREQENELAERLLNLPLNTEHKPLLFTLDELVEFIKQDREEAIQEALKKERNGRSS